MVSPPSYSRLEKRPVKGDPSLHLKSPRPNSTAGKPPQDPMIIMALLMEPCSGAFK